MIFVPLLDHPAGGDGRLDYRALSQTLEEKIRARHEAVGDRAQGPHIRVST